MEKHAVVKGEVHISETDRDHLFDRDLSDFQALYTEGRSNAIRLHKSTNSYFLYLIGYFTLELIYVSIRHIRSTLLSKDHLKQRTHSNGLEFENETDLEISEIYESCSVRLRRWTPIILILLFLISLRYAFITETIQFRGITTGIPHSIIPLILGISLPFIYFSLLIDFSADADREDKMPKKINSIADNRDHDQILVLVGDKHVKAVSRELEKLGWNISSERSSHWLARLRRLLVE